MLKSGALAVIRQLFLYQIRRYAVKLLSLIITSFNLFLGNYKFAIIPEYCKWWFSAFFLSTRVMRYKISYVQKVMLFIMTCFDPSPSVLLGYFILYIGVIGKRAKRARHSLVCAIENWGYIYYGTCNFSLLRGRAIRSALYCSGKNHRNYLKAISSEYYRSNKEY